MASIGLSFNDIVKVVARNKAQLPTEYYQLFYIADCLNPSFKNLNLRLDCKDFTL